MQTKRKGDDQKCSPMKKVKGDHPPEAASAMDNGESDVRVGDKFVPGLDFAGAVEFAHTRSKHKSYYVSSKKKD